MNRHPNKEAILNKLAHVLASLGEEFDGYVDPREGYVLGNEMRDLKARVEKIRDQEMSGRRNSYLKLV
jgi:hypothetical protein